MKWSMVLTAAILAPTVAIGSLVAVDWARHRPAGVSPLLPAAFASLPIEPAAPHSDLPTVAVAPFKVHPAPSDADTAPPKPYTMVPRERHAAEHIRPAPPHHRTVVAMAAAPPPAPQSVAGPAKAIGGARLRVDGHALRLFGVRLPPGDKGVAVRAALAREVGASSVTCEAPLGQPLGQGHSIGFVCREAGGIDLGERLVANGLALADRRSSYAYVPEEEDAREKRLGFWRNR